VADEDRFGATGKFAPQTDISLCGGQFDEIVVFLTAGHVLVGTEGMDIEK
jgi:hypothetical protein